MQKNKKTTLFFLFFFSVFSLFFISCSHKAHSEKRIIAVSTYAMYDIVKHLVGDTFEVVSILPFGVDPHSFEPTPTLMAKIEDASLVVYSGAGLEPWTKNYTFKHHVIDMSKFVSLRKLGDHHHHEEHHLHNGVDPHYWLDIDNMIKATHVIANKLVEIAPNNKILYAENEKNYIASLKQLDNKFTVGLSSCKKDIIVVNHNAFGYLSRRYGFDVESLSGLVPEVEPSAKEMSHILDVVKEHHIKVIFFESFVSAKVIQTLADELHVRVQTLQPLGNITADEAKQKLTYEKIMQENLRKISQALECQ